MKIRKLIIHNYKIFQDVQIDFNKECNIFVGNNDEGKSTLLEAFQIVLSGKLNGFSFERQLTANYFNNLALKEYMTCINERKLAELPNIIIEAYFFTDSGDAAYQGTNNSLGEDAPGIRYEVCFNPIYEQFYKKMLQEEQIFDLPIEFYYVVWRAFSDDPIVARSLPFRLSVIDTTQKDYNPTLNRFVNTSVTDNLTDIEKINLAKTYRKMRHDFNSNTIVDALNERIKDDITLDNRNICFELRESTQEEWKSQVTVDIDDIPFEQIGFGTQNLVKMELAYKEVTNKSSIILLEEPENNLSYSNMSKLISRIQNDKSKQVFISTHSSFVANKLGLQNLFLLHKGKCAHLSAIPEDTMQYFIKLPGYNTLRFLLSAKAILVEGPADELIVQRAYKDKHSVLPIENGIDVISVGALAFKRYCDLAITVGKPISILTDNDGNIEECITKKYCDYLKKTPEVVHVFYEKNESLPTLEPSVLSANSKTEEDSKKFRRVVSASGSMNSKNNAEVQAYMTKNKTEWALRVFSSEECICYPEWVNYVIE